MDVQELFLPLKKGKATYVRIVKGNGAGIPLLILHGGPGSTHNSLELLDPLSEDRPLIFYDQFGCGLSSISTRKEDYSAGIWIEELDALRKYLGLKDVFLLGHSWGGMLLQLYLQRIGQNGIKGAVISSSLCSAELWKEETHRLVKSLSSEDQKAIKEAEESGHYNSPSFLSANEHYMKMTISDIPSKAMVSECLRRKKNSGTLSYLSAWGESEFAPTGSLKDYDTRTFLPNLTCPTLILYGGKDESTETQNKTMFDLIGGKSKKLHCFSSSRHLTYYEANEEYLEIVGEFLRKAGH